MAVAITAPALPAYWGICAEVRNNLDRHACVGGPSCLCISTRDGLDDGSTGCYRLAMLLAGIILMLVGFILVAPRGSSSGSSAHRQTRTVHGSYDSGPAADDSYSHRRIVILVGVAMLAGGLAFILLAS